MGEMMSRRAVMAGLGAAAASASMGALALGAELKAQHGFNDEWIEWKLFGEGLEIAKSENKPIFIVFHATWCPFCRAYREVFFEVEITEMLEGFVPVLVDVDLQADLNERYGEHGKYFPRTMILDPNGVHREEILLEEKFERPYGVQESAELKTFLKLARAAFGLPAIA